VSGRPSRIPKKGLKNEPQKVSELCRDGGDRGRRERRHGHGHGLWLQRCGLCRPVRPARRSDRQSVRHCAAHRHH